MGMNHQPVAIVNLKRHAPLPRCLFEYDTDDGYKCRSNRSLSLVHPITLSLSKLSLLQRMASNDNNGKSKIDEEVESSVVKKKLRLSDDDECDDDSSNSPQRNHR